MDSRAKILEKKIKKSSLRADNIFEYEYLMKETRGLLPCHITEEGEDVCFEFDLTGMHPLSELKKEEMEYRLRFLQNFYEIYRIWTEYDLPLTEENIYYDRNYVPYIAFRDMKQLKKEDEEEYEFRNAYQELAVGILGNKYSYTQVRESGLMIAAKDKALGYILAYKTTEEMYKEIGERAEQIHRENSEEKIRLDKRKYETGKKILAGILCVFILALFYMGYQTFVILPRDQAVIRASRAYTVQNYVECIDELQNMQTDQMDTYTKYILASSYARCEALEKTELENVLKNISIYSNEAELGYWIAIGRSDFTQAENYAKALSDDKLLIYSYMKELNYLEGNINMDGEEKQNRMNELGNAITEISSKYLEE